ncbi:MAG: M48 family metallopeptidase [Erysipelotrichaceae bacterium]|jgi:predicted metal-dependent hydrolase|nr:M48 family metallopeptidase [Erysipelotrichaceae bacterium]
MSFERLEHNGTTIEYFLIRKAIRHINLHIDRDQIIWVSAPLPMPKQIIEDFLVKKWKWILNNKKRVQERQKTHEISVGRQFFYLGKAYALEAAIGRPALIKKEDRLLVYCKRPDDDDNVASTLLNLLARELLSLVRLLRPKYDAIVNDYHLPPPTFKIRNLKARWGSCQVKKHIITLNVQLMHFPLETIESVLWHEYVHLMVPNHSQRFYQLLLYHMPDYQKRQLVLKG